jgi:formylmethanofuran--tetrahydromethanopterin N-formyltransferase
MNINSTEIVDTFAEAFEMWASRMIITADSERWAMAAARSVTGFATSIIGCKCEAGIEAILDPQQTPDNRPGISVLLFATSASGVGKRLVERVGQCVMTCPTTACYDGLPDAAERAAVGSQLRYFGDGYQISKVLGGKRLWRVPVMDGEFLVEESFGVQPAVGGGNILVLGRDNSSTLAAAEAAVTAMRDIDGVILPFPDGVVRSGSKPSSKYKFLFVSTNDAYCPSLRGVVDGSQVADGADCVYEIVIDGLDEKSVGDAMRVGMRAAANNGAMQISAGNYGGGLGKYQIGLHGLME